MVETRHKTDISFYDDCSCQLHAALLAVIVSVNRHSPTSEVLVLVVSESVRRGAVSVQQLVGKLCTVHAPERVVVEEVLELDGSEDGRLASFDHRLM